MLNSLDQINIAGTTQFIYTSGDSLDKPLMLFIHGGPGATLMPYSHILKNLEDEFIVAYWDQRGAGKSYSNDLDRSQMNLNRFVQDAIEIIEYLKEKYNKSKVFISGHSWGSVIGAKVSSKIPSSLYANISISQVANYQKGLQYSYEFAISEAKKREMQDIVDQLIGIGKPPYESLQDLYMVSGIIYQFGGAYHRQIDMGSILNENPIYSDQDIENINKGMQLSAETLIEEIMTIDLISEGVTEFDIPMVFVSGKHDYFSPNQVTNEFYSIISAPSKEMHSCDESAHFPYVEEPEKLIKIMKNVKKAYYID